MRIARDLEAFKYLKLEDSIKTLNIIQYKKQLSLDSVNVSLLTEKIDFKDQIISGLTSQNSLQADISKQLKSQNKLLSWERNGALVLVVAAFIKLLLK